MNADIEQLPVAAQWWAATDEGAGVTKLVERHIDPMLESNVWHVRGRDRDLVVDTGNGIGALHPVIEGLASGRPITAVVTHGHFDHVGGLREFGDRRGHPADADETHTPLQMRLDRARFPEGAAEMFAYYGFPVPPVIVNALPSEDFDAEGWASPGADLTATVEDGDRLDLGDRALVILHVPGHTAGSIALWEADAGLLFSGDTVYAESRLSYDDPITAAASLRRLRDLPVLRVHAGHDRSFGAEEFRSLVDAEVRSIEGRARGI